MSALEAVGLLVGSLFLWFFCIVFLVPVNTTDVETGEPCQRTVLRMALLDLPLIWWKTWRLRRRTKR